MSFRKGGYFRVISILILVVFAFQQASYAAPIYKNLATGTSGDEMQLPGEDLEALKDEVDLTRLAIALMKKDQLLKELRSDIRNTIISFCVGEIVYRNAHKSLTVGLSNIDGASASKLLDAARPIREQVAKMAERPVYYGLYNRTGKPVELRDAEGQPIMITATVWEEEDGKPVMKKREIPAAIQPGRTIDPWVARWQFDEETGKWAERAHPLSTDARKELADIMRIELGETGEAISSQEKVKHFFEDTFKDFVALHETGHEVLNKIMAELEKSDEPKAREALEKLGGVDGEVFANLFAKAALGFVNYITEDEGKVWFAVLSLCRRYVEGQPPVHQQDGRRGARGGFRTATESPLSLGVQRLLANLFEVQSLLRYRAIFENDDLLAALKEAGIDYSAKDSTTNIQNLTFDDQPPEVRAELLAALDRAIDAGQLEAMAAPAAGEEELAGHLAHFGLGTMTTAELVSSLKTPAGEVADEALLRDIGRTPEYVAGIFTREDCATLLGGYDYPEEEAYPVMNKLIAEMSRQLLIIQGNPEPTAQQIDRFARDTLHAESIRDIYRLVYHAQGPQGNLHLSGYGEMELYRMAYRDILELLLGNLTIPGVEPEQLRAVLSNPLRDSNNEGNDEVRDAVSEIMTAGVLTDDVEGLRAEPERTKDWFRYTVASNDIDYTRPSFLEEREKPDFNLVAHIEKIVNMNFVPELDAEAYIDEFIARYALSGEKRALVVEADNNVELIFLLKTCEILLSLNPNLRISFVAKPDNKVINDASVADVERTLSLDGEKAEDDRIFEGLRSYLGKRFVLVEGPRSQGTPLDMIPTPAAQALRDADAVFAMGEANFWCLNGLQKPVYFGLKLKWKPMVQMSLGVDAEKTGDKPPAFFRVDGGPYFRNVASGRPRSVATGESPIQVAELCVRDVLTPPMAPGTAKLAKADDAAEEPGPRGLGPLESEDLDPSSSGGGGSPVEHRTKFKDAVDSAVPELRPIANFILSDSDVQDFNNVGCLEVTPSQVHPMTRKATEISITIENPTERKEVRRLAIAKVESITDVPTIYTLTTSYTPDISTTPATTVTKTAEDSDGLERIVAVEFATQKILWSRWVADAHRIAAQRLVDRGQGGGSEIADLRTGDQILREMYDRQGGLFRREGDDKILPLFRAGRYGDIVTYVEGELVRLADSDRAKYTPSELNMIRCAWGEWLIENGRPEEGRLLLEKDIPGKSFPLAYRIMYRHLMGGAYRNEGTRLLREGNIHGAIRCSRESVVSFEKADGLIAQEAERLKGVAIDPSLEGQRRHALQELENLRDANRYAFNTANCGVITAIAKLPTSEMDANLLLELAGRGNTLLQCHKRGELKTDNLEILQRGTGLAYIKLQREGRDIPFELTTLFYGVMATAPGRRISIPGVEDIELILPSDGQLQPSQLAQQLQQAVQAEGIEGWAQVAKRAQQLAGTDHPNLTAALQPLIAQPENYTGLTPDELQAQAETLIEEHGITDEDEIATLRLCLGLDWGQGIRSWWKNWRYSRLEDRHDWISARIKEIESKISEGPIMVWRADMPGPPLGSVEYEPASYEEQGPTIEELERLKEYYKRDLIALSSSLEKLAQQLQQPIAAKKVFGRNALAGRNLLSEISARLSAAMPATISLNSLKLYEKNSSSVGDVLRRLRQILGDDERVLFYGRRLLAFIDVSVGRIGYGDAFRQLENRLEKAENEQEVAACFGAAARENALFDLQRDNLEKRLAPLEERAKELDRQIESLVAQGARHEPTKIVGKLDGSKFSVPDPKHKPELHKQWIGLCAERDKLGKQREELWNRIEHTGRLRVRFPNLTPVLKLVVSKDYTVLPEAERARQVNAVAAKRGLRPDEVNILRLCLNLGWEQRIASEEGPQADLEPLTGTTLGGIPESVYYGVYNSGDTGVTLLDEGGSPILKDDGKPAVIPSGRTIDIGVMYSSEWYPHLSDVRQLFAEALGVELDGQGRPVGDEETQRNFRVTFGQFALLHETGHQVWDRMLAKHLGADDKKEDKENREAFSNLFAKAALGFDIDDTLPPDEVRIRNNVKLVAPTLRASERILLEGLLGDKPILSYDGRGESDLVVALGNVGIDTIPHMRDLTFKNESKRQGLVAALHRAVDAGRLVAMAERPPRPEDIPNLHDEKFGRIRDGMFRKYPFEFMRDPERVAAMDRADFELMREVVLRDLRTKIRKMADFHMAHVVGHALRTGSINAYQFLAYMYNREGNNDFEEIEENLEKHPQATAKQVNELVTTFTQTVMRDPNKRPTPRVSLLTVDFDLTSPRELHEIMAFANEVNQVLENFNLSYVFVTTNYNNQFVFVFGPCEKKVGKLFVMLDQEILSPFFPLTVTGTLSGEDLNVVYLNRARAILRQNYRVAFEEEKAKEVRVHPLNLSLLRHVCELYGINEPANLDDERFEEAVAEDVSSAMARDNGHAVTIGRIEVRGLLRAYDTRLYGLPGGRAISDILADFCDEGRFDYIISTFRQNPQMARRLLLAHLITLVGNMTTEGAAPYATLTATAELLVALSCMGPGLQVDFNRLAELRQEIYQLYYETLLDRLPEIDSIIRHKVVASLLSEQEASSIEDIYKEVYRECLLHLCNRLAEGMVFETNAEARDYVLGRLEQVIDQDILGGFPEESERIARGEPLVPGRAITSSGTILPCYDISGLDSFGMVELIASIEDSLLGVDVDVVIDDVIALGGALFDRRIVTIPDIVSLVRSHYRSYLKKLDLTEAVITEKVEGIIARMEEDGRLSRIEGTWVVLGAADLATDWQAPKLDEKGGGSPVEPGTKFKDAVDSAVPELRPIANFILSDSDVQDFDNVGCLQVTPSQVHPMTREATEISITIENPNERKEVRRLAIAKVESITDVPTIYTLTTSYTPDISTTPATTVTKTAEDSDGLEKIVAVEFATQKILWSRWVADAHRIAAQHLVGWGQGGGEALDFNIRNALAGRNLGEATHHMENLTKATQRQALETDLRDKLGIPQDVILMHHLEFLCLPGVSTSAKPIPTARIGFMLLSVVVQQKPYIEPAALIGIAAKMEGHLEDTLCKHVARAQPHQPSRMQSEANWQDLAWNKDNVKAVHDKSIAIQKQAVSVTHRKSVFVVIPYDLIQLEERTPLTQFQIQVRRWMENNSNCHVVTQYTSEELNRMFSEGVVEIDGEELTRDNCFAFLDSEVVEANADALARRVRILPLMKPAFGQLIQWEGLANLGLGFLTIKSPKDDPQIRNVRELWNLMIGADFDTQVGPMLGLMFEEPAKFIRELIKISLIALPQEQKFNLQQLRDFYGGAAEYLEGQA